MSTTFGVGYDDHEEYRLVYLPKETSWGSLTPNSDNGKSSIEDIDDKILTDYWRLLSKQAVLHGAGMVKLFFDEVAKEKEAKALYAKNRSWVGRKIDGVYAKGFQLASIFYGSSVKRRDLEAQWPGEDEDKTPAATGGGSTSAILAAPSQVAI